QDLNYIKKYLTNNLEFDYRGEEETNPVPYRWSHGATDTHLGDGLIIYSLIQYMRAKVCVCLGSGGGFIPRIMTQARYDLHKQNIFEGNPDFNYGDIGSTYIVDAMNGIGGVVDWFAEESFFRRTFHPRIINSTTEEAFYDFFVLQDIKIDYLHIDAGHSYENVKEDFDLYSQIMSENGIISMHDTDPKYHDKFIVTQEVKDRNEHDDWSGPIKLAKEIDSDKWEVFNLFNHGIVKNKPSSTGLTLIRRK
ncbi:class I SAM-dependent methyltransferase, partial [archaeon]|nr:class I SAM-dependent methyltransferase [archaeon]